MTGVRGNVNVQVVTLLTEQPHYVLVIVPSNSFERGQLNLQYKPCQYRADEIIANIRAISQVGDMVYDPIYLYFK